MDPSKTSFKSQLHAAMTAQFVRTKRGWKRVLGLGAVLFLLSMVSVLVGTMRIAVVVDFLIPLAPANRPPACPQITRAFPTEYQQHQ